MATREQIRYKAVLAESAKRYPEMANYVKDLVTGWASPPSALTLGERELLHEAYEKVVCPLRHAWRTVWEAEQNEEARKNGNPVELMQRYRLDLEDKISHVCAEILKLLEEILIPSASSSESEVFYLTMRGDYYRYLAEIQVGDEREKAAYAAMVAYKVAENVARAHLSAVHPTRLSLALNSSVFFYETLNLSEDGYNMAKKAIDEAGAELRSMRNGLISNAVIPIMTLLRKNVNLWANQNYIYDG